MMTYEEFIEHWQSPSEFVDCFTSGSTGIPKLIKLPKKMMMESAIRTNSFFKLEEGAHFHSCISAEYIGGKMMAVRSLVAGGKFSYEEPSNQPLCNYYGETIDLLALVPSQMFYLIQHPSKLSKIKNIIIGGAPIGDKLRKQISALNINAFETYGMTETASHIALRKISHPQAGFRALDNIKLDCDQHQRLVIQQHYLETSANEINKLINNKIITNDLVEFHTDGTFEIIGRFDNIVNSGGIKVIPEKIEIFLEKELGCEVLISSEPDDKWGEIVILQIDDQELHYSDEDIIRLCKQKFPKGWTPKKINRCSIPKTSNGKKKRIKTRKDKCVKG